MRKDSTLKTPKRTTSGKFSHKHRGELVMASGPPPSLARTINMRHHPTDKQSGVPGTKDGRFTSGARVLSLSIALLMLLLSPLAANAQFESASVLGYVKDSTGAVVPGVAVTLTNTATGISRVGSSDSDGRYEFSSVPIGSYVVKAEAKSFAPAQTPSFTLTTDARQRVDLEMKAGSANEVVTVTSAPTALETETSSRSQVVGTKQIEELPLNGRS